MIMEKDEHLKKLLLAASGEASPGFADAVMKRVKDLPLQSSGYQPLVPPKWERLFLMAFCILVFAILLLILVITLSNLNFEKWLPGLAFSFPGLDKVIAFLIIFWVIFSVNAALGNRQTASFRRGK